MKWIVNAKLDECLYSNISTYFELLDNELKQAGEFSSDLLQDAIQKISWRFISSMNAKSTKEQVKTTRETFMKDVRYRTALRNFQERFIMPSFYGQFGDSRFNLEDADTIVDGAINIFFGVALDLCSYSEPKMTIKDLNLFVEG